jgi:MOSC domain-containing protein YiiM
MTGRVVSVNVGTPRVHDWQGREFVTAIFKEPVDGPVMLADDHAAGDEQADTVNHGGRFQAVYAYASEDSDWWSGELGQDVVPGMFGENLTVHGVEVTGARLGEVWQVGGAAIQVTAPRIPCSNLGLRFADTGMPRRFQDAARPGAYFAILAEGEVAAGDDIEVVSRPDHDVTVGDVFRAYYDRDRDFARRMLEVDGVPPGWHNWARTALES